MGVGVGRPWVGVVGEWVWVWGRDVGEKWVESG